MKEYQKGDFCKAMDCPMYSINDAFCKTDCHYTAYDFHNWLNEQGYRIIPKDVYTLTIKPNAAFNDNRDEE